MVALEKHQDIRSIAFYFSIAAGIYLNARLVSPRIPETGEIDLQVTNVRRTGAECA